MGLDLWFPEDVARMLAGLGRQAARQPASERRDAYLDALGDVAASFGLAVPAVRVERHGNGDGRVVVYDLLEGGDR